MKLSPAELAARQQRLNRRWFLQDCGIGLGSIALGALLSPATLNPALAGAAPPVVNPLAPKAPHFPGKAKRVIYLFQAGAPSHLELFDPKPELAKWDGKLPPAELLKGYRAAFISPNSALLGPKFKFAKQGQSGIELSEILPHTSQIADELCVVKSVVTDAFNHAPAQILMNTGSSQFGRPSMGAWVTYGLGSDNQNLPGFVVFSTGKKGTSGGASNYGCGFLPTVYQGVPFRGVGDPVLYLSNPAGIDDPLQGDTIDAIAALNREHLAATGDPEIATRIHSYELAHSMQHVAPEIMDLNRESKETLALYGAEPGKQSYANACLLARRLVENGVRFVQIFHEAWDHHGDLTNGLKRQCGETDQASAALVKDLKQRGLLEDTLVIWGGEFGRTPMVQGGNDGRDHHPNAFTMWFAGGGVKAGSSLGRSDDFGFNVVEDKVHVHDLHATLLHLLGFDHTKLNVRFQGLNFRLTGVEGEVFQKMLA
ncbi:MAG TPA: DUF1501 domain-containing protein [Pirellulales bacterium]|jgi:hypothetical protein|nr:DUF1501 domain-containing protein [Pirellulales bacterium]